ncbi:MAG: alkaline phosphatase family protein, partial [Proteobacteria bacterium]|nr:alkaline phosphatase family protein [Pseudomonadota bacterium]
MHTKIGADVVANGRNYARPQRPTVVICMDGSEPAYIEAASAKGLTPNLDRIMKTGASTHAYSVIPSFTNPNN